MNKIKWIVIFTVLIFFTIFLYKSWKEEKIGWVPADGLSEECSRNFAKELLDSSKGYSWEYSERQALEIYSQKYGDGWFFIVYKNNIYQCTPYVISMVIIIYIFGPLILVEMCIIDKKRGKND